MESQRVVEWQAPKFEEDSRRKKSWVDELCQNGERALNGMRSIANCDDDVKVLMGHNQDLDVESNTLMTDMRVFVETIADLRQIVTYGAAEQYKKSVEAYNSYVKHLFWMSHFNHQTRKVLQYALLGRGYMWPAVITPDYGWGKPTQVFRALGPKEVLLEQLPADNDVDQAYAVTIMLPMPIAEAHARFPEYQDDLKPVSRYDWKAYGTLGLARTFDFWDRWRFGEEGSDWDNRYCLIRLTFIRDQRINRTGYKMDMDKNAPWGYEVPSVGDLIVSTNPFNGLPESRKATYKDCRVYPQLRLMITSPSVPVPMRDKCAFDWHGRMPVVPYEFNDWPWSPIGYSIVHGVASLERARRKLVSQIQTVVDVTLDPPLGYDLHSGVSREQVKRLQLLKAQGYRVGVNMDPKKAISSILPDSIRVQGEHFKQIEVIDDTIRRYLGTNNANTIKDLKMNVSENSFDKIVESLGPIGRGASEIISVAHSKIGYMLKFNIPQYNTVAEIISFVGPDGVSMQTFDYDPNSLIPSHLPHETPGDGSSLSAYSKRERAKWFADQMPIVSVPSQLLNYTHQQERMMYLLFLQKGVPVPMSVIMEKLGVQNYGKPTGDTLYEQWKSEQIDKLLFEFRAKVIMAMEMKKYGIEMPEQGGPGKGKGGGRPPSGKAAPKQEMRGTTTGNPRVITSQSK